MITSMALTGTNGNNQTNIGSSRSVSLAIYDENSIEIPVRNLAMPMDFWIAKDPSVPVPSYKYIKAINASQLNASRSLAYLNDSQVMNGFIVTGIQLTGANISLHIQLKPINTSLNYLVLVKFGDNPTLNNQYYDSLSLFCSNDLITEANNTSFYLTFLNMSKVNGYKGYLGISIKELQPGSIDCVNKNSSLNDMLLKMTSNQNQSFTSDYWLRIYSAGCYYTDPDTLMWSSDGLEIMSDTTIELTHCQSNHLTTFAGGFIVLPPAIDFNKAFANASFLDNPVIYSTVIALISVYILLAIWARWMDVKDRKKVGVTLLGDEHSNIQNKYAYEIIVFTGGRLHAGTTSIVNFLIKINVLLLIMIFILLKIGKMCYF